MRKQSRPSVSARFARRSVAEEAGPERLAHELETVEKAQRERKALEKEDVEKSAWLARMRPRKAERESVARTTIAHRLKKTHPRVYC